MNDLISRQAAINIGRNVTVDTNPDHFEAHQKFTQFLDDAEISSFGRWQWSNGFNTALTAVSVDLRRLPSAQPETSRIENVLHGKSAEEQYDFIWWLLQNYAMNFTDSRRAAIEWLKGGQNEQID